MLTQDFLTADYEDLLFRNRNKRYGAYLLRKLYPKHLNEAFLITLLLASLLFGIPMVCNQVSHSSVLAPVKTPPKEIFTLYFPPTVSLPKASLPKTVAKPVNPKLAPVIKPDQNTKMVASTPDVITSIPAITSINGGIAVSAGIISTPSIGTRVIPSTGPTHVPQTMPSFPGGLAALEKYLQDHLQYPYDAISNNIEGQVVVQFVVDENGMISDIKVLRDIGGKCADEAVRVIKSMPAWIPGENNGQHVKVYYVLPVSFQLKH